MFIGPWDQGGPFGLEGISGVERWLNRVWNVVQAKPDSAKMTGTVHASYDTSRIRRSAA
jgi:leucyl-tRNA synthetase